MTSPLPLPVLPGPALGPATEQRCWSVLTCMEGHAPPTMQTCPFLTYPFTHASSHVHVPAPPPTHAPPTHHAVDDGNALGQNAAAPYVRRVRHDALAELRHWVCIHLLQPLLQPRPQPCEVRVVFCKGQVACCSWQPHCSAYSHTEVSKWQCYRLQTLLLSISPVRWPQWVWSHRS